MVQLQKIVSFLDRELNIADVPDNSNNGLQVENSGVVTRVCTGVDASSDFFMEAAKRGANLVICHHGISWKNSLKRITGLNYKRIKFLIDHDMALYACHLPLDIHPKLGNNAIICTKLGLKDVKPFGSSHGIAIGYSGALPRAVPYAEFLKTARSIFGNISGTMNFGRQSVSTVAVVSGGGAGEIMEAGESGIDVFLSGEPRLAAYHAAREYGINAVFAGHHATETFGVHAVASLISENFRVSSEFIDADITF